MLVSNRSNKLFMMQFNHVGYIVFFLKSLTIYFIHKLFWIVELIKFITIRNLSLIISIKFTATAKLIWSRGLLGRYMRYVFIGILMFGVYLMGGVYQHEITDEDDKANQTYLSSLNSFVDGRTHLNVSVSHARILDSPVNHIVVKGENVNTIGRKYGISVESIKFANNLSGDYLKVGRKLKIPRVDGAVHTVKRGDTIASLAKRYNVPEQTIVDFNYIDAPYLLSEGQLLTIPEASLHDTKRNFVGREVYDSSAYGIIPIAKDGPGGTGKFAWPLSGILTQKFHRYHPAIDIANSGSNIIAADEGTVVRAGWWKGGYGNAVQINHRNGYVTTYAHMSSIAVSTGQDVKKGEAIGVVGSTGRSTGPHVHFTIQLDGKYLNPLSFLKLK